MANGFTPAGQKRGKSAGMPEVHVHIDAAMLDRAGRMAPHTAPAADRPRFRAQVQSDGTLELMVYGDIVDAATISLLEYFGVSTDGFVSALNVKKALDAAVDAKSVRVRINSPGGDAFEGIAIHSLLTGQQKPVETCVDGIAASAASIIAMAGKTRKMGRGAMLMIHDCWTIGMGNSRDFRKLADTLDKIDESIAETYVARTGLPADKVRSLMNAENWMSAKDCVEQGFATEISEQPEEVTAQALAQARGFRALAKMKNLPEPLRNSREGSVRPSAANDNECDCVCEACQDNRCKECSNAECQDAHCEGCPMQEENASAAVAQPVTNFHSADAWLWEKQHGITA